jgi:ribosomal protein S18 acetylase RimI-like enzyme
MSVDDVRILEVSTADDREQCVRMMLASNPWNRLYFSYEQCARDLADSQTLVHVARDGTGQIIGFIASLARGIEMEPIIEYLCVDARWRRRGVGTTLIDFFENTLYPEADNLYMFVSDINPEAIRLYERLGYQRVGVFPDFNLVGQTEFLYRKSRRPRQARFVPGT